MKIYTKTGDKGQTALFGGQRVSKAHVRIDAYGLVDQLNAQLGIVLLHVKDDAITAICQRTQSVLFNLGSDLATPLSVQNDYIVRMTEADYEQLEREIDLFDSKLPPLKTFILPGGTAAASHLHMARTICRQAERATVRLAEIEEINEAALVYLNRLSDWFFVLTRLVNHRSNVPDVPWVSPKRNKP